MATVRPLPCVNPHVLPHAALLLEMFPTDEAAVGSLACVNPYMLPQATLFLEGLSTHMADEA